MMTGPWMEFWVIRVHSDGNGEKKKKRKAKKTDLHDPRLESFFHLLSANGRGG